MAVIFPITQLTLTLIYIYIHLLKTGSFDSAIQDFLLA